MIINYLIYKLYDVTNKVFLCSAQANYVMICVPLKLVKLHLFISFLFMQYQSADDDFT